MWTLLSCFKSRYATDLRSQTVSMPAEARQSLTQKIVQTLEEGGQDEEDGRENVEELLDKIELDLEAANQQLSQRQEKEQFLAVRINKYKEMLKEQGDHLNQLQERISSGEGGDPETLEQQQRRYEEQVEKQFSHKVALGKVVDVHMDILKSIKDCQRTIAGLEQKKYELKSVTKKCREFLVMAEEAEREQQLGVLVDEDDADENDLQMTEMAPLAMEDPDNNITVVDENATMKMSDEDGDENTPCEPVDEETGLESESSKLLQSEIERSTERGKTDVDVPMVEPTLESDEA